MSPEFPCGVRFNDVAQKNETINFALTERMHVQSRSLDLASSEQAKTELIIKKQKQNLSKLIARLNQMSSSFDSSTKNSFNKLIKESRPILKKDLFKNEKKEAKKLNLRNTKEELNAEIQQLFAKSRNLIKAIQKNLRVKTRVR